ncbi:hypothetical protein EPN81_02960 [Patescibacteria group bacterium]|nr:MAG: hypothetical protein EPN81_02960 [Patescibacteria group bacterium]
MKRLALSLIWVIFILTSVSSLAQTSWQDDGMFWIALTLIDQDAPGVPLPIHDHFVQLCTQTSPHTLDEWMPDGFQQRDADQPRVLHQDVCEQIVPLKLTGATGWLPTQFVIPWQPGQDARRHIGVPRETVGRVSIQFPEVLRIGDHAYQIPDPVIVTMSRHQQSASVLVPLRRLARVLVNGSDSQAVIPDKRAVISDGKNYFLLPGEQRLTVSKGYRLHVVVVDPHGQRQNVTDPRYPKRLVELLVYYGLIYEVRVVPQQQARPTWLTKLRTP